MAIVAVKQSRSLQRGLEVIRHLNREHALSLHELHVATQLSRATLSRILLTLQTEGFATQRIADSKWVLKPMPQPQKRSDAATDTLARVASSILDDLCRRIIWPSDLSVRIGSHMEVVETSRAHSSLVLGRIGIGFPINMLLSAPGRAYLAFCTDRERDQLVARLKRKRALGQDIAMSDTAISHLMEDTRRQGFGARDDTWGGHIEKSKSAYDDGLNAIAVPIHHKGRVLGCINIVWIRHLISQSEMVRRNLGDLKHASAVIADAFEQEIGKR